MTDAPARIHARIALAVLLAPRVDVPLGVWAALFTPPWTVLCARAAVVSFQARDAARR